MAITKKQNFKNVNTSQNLPEPLSIVYSWQGEPVIFYLKNTENIKWQTII